SALNIVIGNGWKLVVMGEVLTTSTGIGGAITTARLNIEPDAIIAWAVILVTLCFATEWLLRRLLFGRRGKRA
nr:ABC transporter permease [Clostridiales bacterium]